jgi:hypothetical protein
VGFFEHYFDIVNDGGNEEVAVRCPFPHVTPTGVEYYESNPSAHINTKTRMFHCKVCNQGHSEISFITKIFDTSYGNATRLAKVFNNDETLDQWKQYTTLSTDAIALAESLGISKEVLEELHVANNVEGTLLFPVFMKDKLVDIRAYTPGGNPKIKSRPGALQGEIIPLDLWQQTPLRKTTLICAGEKDMATTRSHGFNAITITGGEMALPFSPTFFKGRDVVILYDNDNAGKLGANRLATYLLDYCRTVKVCTKFHEICTEDKEDITDFWNKYHGTREQLIQMMNETPLFTREEAVHENPLPLVTLAEATSPKYINKMVRSNIQVVAISETQYVAPTTITGEKIKDTGKGDTMYVGEVRDWEMTENSVQDILHLMDGGFKEEDIKKNILKLLHLPAGEKYVKLNKLNKTVVYKGYVTDMFESMNTDTMPMEYTAYSIGTRLESGKKYMCTYKLVPHPYKGQQLIMLITNAVPANDSVSNFKITAETKQNLAMFQDIPGTVPEKLHSLTQKVKGLLGYNGNDLLIMLLDLAYHTVLSFNLGQFKNVRGYLDTLIVGESRVGKSSTADTLRKLYQLGTFTSLAGNSATIPGLVGGSNKTAGGSMQTKAGLIPQNHKGLIIFEEFGKCNSNITAELTDIRSSNEVRITRVSGTLSLPAMVRMISLSNVKSTGSNEIKSIASYPNGIAIVTELVPTAEDIARYDLLCVLSDKGNAQIDPYWQPETPLPTEAYQTRVRWVWSRTADQILIAEEVGNYIIQQANELNKTYDCHIKIFGTEAWKKLSRLAIAIAGYLVSTDESYQNIVVLKEHVDFAVNLLIQLYDNPTFRLKEYVENERKYNCIDDAGIQLLQEMYIKVPQLLIMLEQEARPSRNSLMAAVGLDANQYNGFMSQLIRGSFIKLAGMDIIPTERFRLGMARINRNGSLVRIGENNA